jgi:hypothetical protein
MSSQKQMHKEKPIILKSCGRISEINQRSIVHCLLKVTTIPKTYITKKKRKEKTKTKIRKNTAHPVLLKENSDPLAILKP